jgi:hypothetical protein
MAGGFEVRGPLFLAQFVDSKFIFFCFSLNGIQLLNEASRELTLSDFEKHFKILILQDNHI